MLNYLKLGVVVMGLVSGLYGAGGISSPADDMHAFADLVRAQGEFRLNLSQANLNDAQAQLQLAKAAREFQRARELMLLVNRLQIELRNSLRDEAQNRQQLQQLQGMEKSLNLLKLGQTGPRVFQALNFIIMRAVSPEALAKTMSTQAERYAADNFIANGQRTPAADFLGSNVGQLFNFLRKNNLSLEPFSPAHMVVLQALTEFSNDAISRIGEIRAKQDELQNRRFLPTPEPVGPPILPPNTPPISRP